MIWDKVKEQPFAVRILKAHIENNRLSSTYLVTGKKESGAKELAAAFASALLCTAKKSFEECSCSNCSRILNRNHPDVRWMGDSEARSLKIEQVREMTGWASFKPYEGKWKVGILEDADRLTLEASNAFLKTLEEPPAQTIFCLLVGSKAQVLETIQSRAFEIRLKPLESKKEEFITKTAQQNWEEFLENYEKVPREELKKVLDSLMNHFRNSMEQAALHKSRNTIPALLDAADIVYGSKEALDANANQKLVLSRLAMRLRSILPQETYKP